ncbi:MAG: CapA family protein [Clostridia bacterium]|nr:CapA family protein [Clostridia bacterium]
MNMKKAGKFSRALALSLLCLALSGCGLTVPTPPFAQVSASASAAQETQAAPVFSSSVTATDPPETSGQDRTNALETLPVTETQPAPEETRIKFLAAGDNVIHPNIYQEAKRRAKEGSGYEYDFLPVYENIADLVESADIAFINQETLMGGKELGYSGYPRFNSPQDLGYQLEELGFDVVNIANNHMCDKGETGLENTIGFWKSLEGVTMIGGYENEEDFNSIRYIDCKGVRIALLSYTYGTNGLSLPSGSELVVPYINKSVIKSQLEAAQSVGDLVFVSVHWGEENHFETSSEQRELAKFMAENGADAIIGHHPHVVQAIEWIEGKNGKTLCVYSLGNLISGMRNGYNMLGGLMTFDVVSDGTGRPRVENPLFIPTAFYYADNWYDTKLFLLEDYGEEFSKTHGSRKQGKLTDRKGMEELLKKTIDREFLPDWLYDDAPSSLAA